MKEISYQKLRAELDEVVEALQSADADIDDAVKKYERGMEIIKQLESYLKTAENRVKKIKQDFNQPAA